MLGRADQYRRILPWMWRIEHKMLSFYPEMVLEVVPTLRMATDINAENDFYNSPQAGARVEAHQVPKSTKFRPENQNKSST